MSTALDRSPATDVRLTPKDGTLRPARPIRPGSTPTFPRPACRTTPPTSCRSPTATSAASGSAARRKASRTSRSISRAFRRGGDRWSEAEKLSDDPTRSEQNPILFPAPDGSAVAAVDRADLRQPGHRHRPPPDLRATTGKTGVRSRRCSTRVGASGVFVRQPPAVLDNGDMAAADLLLPRPARREMGRQRRHLRRPHLDAMAAAPGTNAQVPGSTGCVHMGVVAAPRRLAARALPQPLGGQHLREPLDRSRPQLVGAGADRAAEQQFLDPVHAARQRPSRAGVQRHQRRGRDRAARPRSTTTSRTSSGAAGARRARRASGTAVWGAPRAPMTLAISEDGGRTWPRKRNLEVGDGYCMTNNSREQLNREYSYPSIKQGPDGALHIAFTYFRQAIKYVRVDEDLGDAGEPRAARDRHRRQLGHRRRDRRAPAATTAGRSPASAARRRRSAPAYRIVARPCTGGCGTGREQRSPACRRRPRWCMPRGILRVGRSGGAGPRRGGGDVAACMSTRRACCRRPSFPAWPGGRVVLIGSRTAAARRTQPIRGDQSGPRRPRTVLGRRARAARHHRQRGRSGRDRHADAAGSRRVPALPPKPRRSAGSSGPRRSRPYVVFLLSPDAGAITGQQIVVCGGASL